MKKLIDDILIEKTRQVMRESSLAQVGGILVETI